MKKYWVRWLCVNKNAFELHSPWWISGYTWDSEDNHVNIFCAAIKALNEEEAQQKIIDAYDSSDAEIEFSFCEDRDDEWSPYCDRFPKADWMSEF